jgi:NADH-quinone oxidoreductase subunit M
MTAFPILTLIIFLPLVGGLLLFAVRGNPNRCRWISLGVTLADLLLVVSLFFFELRPIERGWLLVEDHAWIPSLGVRYSLALDGISLVLAVLTAFLSVLCVLVSWKEINSRLMAFHFFLLSMETGVLGVFLATDLFLFYLFWELQVIPMFFLIGIWGHENRIFATVKFVLFSIAGSLLMLIALIGLYFLHGSQAGHYTFSLFELARTPLAPNVEMWLYAAFLLAFAIKVPMFPVHTWLPDAHTEAPTAGSVILAGLLLKTGAYALLRFAFPLFPNAAADSMPLLLGLGLIGLFYAAWIALAQSDLKRLVAYSSISHMGLIVIGIAVWNTITLSGALLLMVNHGLTTSALFILVGMLSERAGSREFSHFGGLWKNMPVFGSFFLLFGMASVGLPGLNNFVSEILILLGTFKERPVLGVIAFAAIVFVLVYGLRMIQDTIFGDAPQGTSLPDLTSREVAILVPLAAAVVVLGLYPGPVLDLVQDPVQRLVDELDKVMIAGRMLNP